MRVVVLGAGVIGVTSAWYLAQEGHEVTVVERQADVALETSFANGGQISVCHAEPWAHPGVLPKILRWLGRENAPLLWRLRLDPAQWAWGVRFLTECRAARTCANIEALVQLGLYSRLCLRALRDEQGLAYDQLQRGILHFYTDEAEFAHAIPQAELMTALGCERKVVSAADCVAIEPALRHSQVAFFGGTYTPADESGDVRKFSLALADKCRSSGVDFQYRVSITGFEQKGGKISAALLSNGQRIEADAYVVCLGSYTPLLFRSLGIRLPIYPAKGYSITVPLSESSIGPSVSLTDDGYKLVYSRLGQRLRVAGTAEFNGYDTTLNRARLDALVARSQELFPRLEPAGPIEEWAGLRPATPGNVPYIGCVRYPNLFVNSGHGTLGWTLACGSGQLLADLVTGKPPGVDAKPYQPCS